MDKKLAMTQGPIGKQLLLFFFPIALGTFFQQLYNTVDTIIVGQYVGTSALAAVGSTGNLINLIVYFFVGLSTGASVVIAQYYGAQDENRLSQAIHTSVAMSIICGVLMMLFGLFFSYSCLKAIVVPQDILNDASLYMTLYFLGMLPGVVYNIGAAILRAVGDAKTPLYYLAICCVINIVFDYLFVAVFHYGVAGAAVASVIGQLVCAILVSLKLMKEKTVYQVHIKKIRLNRLVLEKIIRLGLPAGLQSNMYSISNIVLQTHINAFGTNTIAAWAVYIKIDALFWLVIGALGSAITTFVGQNYGAHNYERIKKGTRSALIIAFVASFLISGILNVFSDYICILFSSDTNIIKECTGIIHYLTPFYFTYCCVEIFSGTMRGCGESLKPMILVCLGICVLRIVWVVLITPIFKTFNTVIISYPISWVVTSVLFIIYYCVFKKKALRS